MTVYFVMSLPKIPYYRIYTIYRIWFWPTLRTSWQAPLILAFKVSLDKKDTSPIPSLSYTTVCAHTHDCMTVCVCYKAALPLHNNGEHPLPYPCIAHLCIPSSTHDCAQVHAR